jgi:hypothetical protein
VHYNLCAGTVLGLGNEQQIKVLDEWQDQGLLGCFSLTEKLAGVNSGLVVNTQAHWDPNTQTFNLHSPNLGAYKNWISQGLVADKTVAVADLFIKVLILQSRYIVALYCACTRALTLLHTRTHAHTHTHTHTSKKAL